MKKLDRIFLIINWVYLMGIVVLAVLSFMAGHLIIPTAWGIIILLVWGLISTVEYFIEALTQVDELSKLLDPNERITHDKP